MPPSIKTQRRVRSLGRVNRKTSRRLRRTQSAERYTNVTTEKVGEGGFGIVSRPPARCARFFSQNSKNINARNIDSIVYKETYYNNPDYISKLTELYEARKELEIGDIIKSNIKHWEDYYCFIEFICGAPKDKHVRITVNEYQDTYAIAPYCGITLDSILKGNYYITSKEACCLIGALKGLIEGLSFLHKIQVYHQDIHSENVLFNPKDGKMRLIDFGLALDLFDEKSSDVDWEMNPKIVTARHFDAENLIFKIIEPVLLFIQYKLKGDSNNKCLKIIEKILSKIPISPNNVTYPNRSRVRFDIYFKFLVNRKDLYVDFINEFIYTDFPSCI